ncbi:hypothetical protein ACFVFQ_16045 [Streptomyces sp. NPDC057743]|uniref:hypothetical protein n=1 Tax=Streptomyces sp. NPDC057743 TaxID=3346236 RepID=UPI0036AA0457
MPTNTERRATPTPTEQAGTSTDAATQRQRRPSPRPLWGVAWAALLLACWLCGGAPAPLTSSPALLPPTGDATVDHAPATGPPPPRDTAPQPQHD